MSTEVLRREDTWIESEAVAQLEATARLPGVVRVVGMPDLHPGPGAPIGIACHARLVYPHLVGSDVGCGMALWQLDRSARRLRVEEWARDLAGLESSWDGDAAAWLAGDGLPPSHLEVLGTVGGGNHFAEVQKVESVEDAAALEAIGLDPRRLLALVHSGSRTAGAEIAAAHREGHGLAGLESGSPEAGEYLRRHDGAVAWARSSRRLIAHRLAEGLGTGASPLFDRCHNFVEAAPFRGEPCWLHRKGASPADRGPVAIPGSRGDWTYLVVPTAPDPERGASLAHGAGRKWGRSEARAKGPARARAVDLRRTALGGRVVCEDRELLYEEMPAAYKKVESVIRALVEHDLVRVAAVLRPLVTYKTRGKRRRPSRRRKRSPVERRR